MTDIRTRGKRRPKASRGRQRRAMVAVVVLLLIAVALATSYSAMRSQTVTLNLRKNAVLGASARQAALTGLNVALRKMHSANWTGTGSTLTGALGTSESFQVAFVAGDDTLTAADADYAELPYRVTLLVTGTAFDPADSRRSSQHTIRAVVRLVPRAVPAEPSDWSAMQNYTFYQTHVYYTSLNPPCRVQGPIRLQGKLLLGDEYPDDSDAWLYYFHHLNVMREAGYGDYRTVTGRVDYDNESQEWYIRQILTGYMAVSTSDLDVDTANSDWVKPTCLTSYRLFPGGPEYSIPTLCGTISNRTLGSSVTENPLGFYYAACSLVLGCNVTVRGTLFCQEEIRVTGTNVVLESLNQLPVHGSSLPIRLPVAVCRDFTVRPSAACTVGGLLAAFGAVNVDAAASRGTFTLKGRLVAQDLDIHADSDWDCLGWAALYDQYYASLTTGWTYFPMWMQSRGYPYAPTVVIKPGDDASYHWYRTGESLYVAHADDFSQMDATETPGLRWELIDVAHPSDNSN